MSIAVLWKLKIGASTRAAHQVFIRYKLITMMIKGTSRISNQDSLKFQEQTMRTNQLDWAKKELNDFYTTKLAQVTKNS